MGESPNNAQRVAYKYKWIWNDLKKKCEKNKLQMNLKWFEEKMWKK